MRINVNVSAYVHASMHPCMYTHVNKGITLVKIYLSPLIPKSSDKN